MVGVSRFVGEAALRGINHAEDYGWGTVTRFGGGGSPSPPPPPPPPPAPAQAASAATQQAGAQQTSALAAAAGAGFGGTIDSSPAGVSSVRTAPGQLLGY